MPFQYIAGLPAFIPLDESEALFEIMCWLTGKCRLICLGASYPAGERIAGGCSGLGIEIGGRVESCDCQNMAWESVSLRKTQAD